MTISCAKGAISGWAMTSSSKTFYILTVKDIKTGEIWRQGSESSSPAGAVTNLMRRPYWAKRIARGGTFEIEVNPL